MVDFAGNSAAAHRPTSAVSRTIRAWWPDGDARAHGLQPLHGRYEPGADTGEAMLEHPSHEGGVVISGELEVTVGSVVRVLKAGETYLFDSRVPRRFRNVSGKPCVIVSACTPPYL